MLGARQRLPVFGLYLALLCTYLVYAPGFTGPFMLDDYPNLSPMSGAGQGIAAWGDFWQFVISGNAGVGGRALSLASFAIDAQDWPADAEPFKRTGVLLHLLNGVLVFVLLRKLFGRMANSYCEWIALAGATIWLLHPLNLSSVLYVIQRMTQLSTSFILLGLILYVHGRCVLTDQLRRGYVWITAGLVGCTALATLAKENGALLPLFALVLEVTLLQGLARPAHWRKMRWPFLILPQVAIAAYLMVSLPRFMTSYTLREFGLYERVLTQSRVLLDYLGQIFLPRLSSLGIFRDDYLISRGLFTPPTTLFAIASIAGLLWAGIALRQRRPVLAFAVMWFFAGHLLESTVVPLELYFEHRNYLPMLGPVVVLVWSLMELPAHSRIPRWAVTGLLMTYAVLLGAMTHNSASVWGDERVAMKVWSTENPGSPRARQAAAAFWSERGVFQAAYEQLADGYKLNPHHHWMLLPMLQMQCRGAAPEVPLLKWAVERLPTSTVDRSSLSTLERIRELINQGKCPTLTTRDVIALADAYLRNPIYFGDPGLRISALFARAEALADQRRFAEAVEMMEEAYGVMPNFIFRYWQVIWSLAASDIKAARRYLELAKARNATRAWRDPDRSADIENLDAAIKMIEDILAGKKPT